MDSSDPSLYDESAPSISSGSCLNVISEAEATFYYAGISPSPPKLVYRTSKDPFVPKGPGAYRHLKHLYPVYDHRLADRWEEIRPKIRDLLDRQQVRFSAIDLVRFRTVPLDEQTPPVIGPVVIWVGVLPDSLAGGDALNFANAILLLLEDADIAAVEIEFRESVFRRSADAELYAPASNDDPTRDFTDLLTTALGLPIAAAATPHFEGTMGFYFKDGDDLYGVTARHVLFPEDKDNRDYTYHPSGPPNKVLLMGTKTWDDYLASIQNQIGTLGATAKVHRDSIGRLEGRVVGDTPAAEEARQELLEARQLLEATTNLINTFQELYERTTKGFGELSQRVIGHIVWSPAITVGTAPYGYTKDVCVVKLDKARFLRNFKGNVIDLGTC